MLWILFAMLLLLCLLGWGFHLPGTLVHVLIAIALITALVDFLSRRRAV